MPSHGSIGDLCVALAHRWEPERPVVIMTVYLDESGTHEGSAATVMAGLMANTKQWQRCERALKRVKKAYGFKIFHAKDFRALRGEFAGWSEARCIGCLNELGIACSDLMLMATCALPNAAYDAHYRNGDRPKKLRLDTKYGLCFRYLLYQFVGEAVRRTAEKHISKAQIHFVLESGHPNGGDAQRIFSEVKADIGRMGFDILKTISFAGKHEADPLMVADFLAFGTYRQETSGEFFFGDNRADEERRQKGTPFVKMDFTEKALCEIKSRLISKLKTRHEAIFVSDSLSVEG